MKRHLRTDQLIDDPKATMIPAANCVTGETDMGYSQGGLCLKRVRRNTKLPSFFSPVPGQNGKRRTSELRDASARRWQMIGHINNTALALLFFCPRGSFLVPGPPLPAAESTSVCPRLTHTPGQTSFVACHRGRSNGEERILSPVPPISSKPGKDNLQRILEAEWSYSLQTLF